MKIALLGDAHGDLAALARATHLAREAGAEAAIQFGDLGFHETRLGPGRALPTLALPVFALCGNHEDHAFLRQARASGLARRWAEAGLIYQPRASCARIGGQTIGFLGGALHVDRPQESDNRPSADDIQGAIHIFSAQRPALIATHSCPAGIGIGMRGSDGFTQALHDHVRRAGIDPGPPDDCGEPGLTDLWHALPTPPRLWVFGHFHHFHDRSLGQTRFLSCPALSAANELLIWDNSRDEIIHTQPYR